MNSKPRVAILLHGLGANGIDSLFANLSSEWSSNVEMTYFLAVDEDNPQFWEKKVRKSNVRIIKLHDLNKGRLRHWPFTLIKALKDYGPFDAIHSNMDMLNGVNILIAKLMGIPIRVSHAHRGDSITQSHWLSGMISKSYRKIMRICMNLLSSHKLACSEVAGKYFFGNRDYTLMYNGLDLQKYLCAKDKRQPDCTKPRFITVGRITDQKNPFKIVDLFAEIIKLMPEATLTWVGDGDMRQEIEAYIHQFNLQGNIRMVGLSQDVPLFLNKADYFLLPSLFEGLSIALIEAQAAGLECFVSDTCSPLSDCGMCTFIPLNDSSKKWAEIIYSHVTAKSTRPKVNDKLLSRFRISDMARKLEEIYEGK